MAQPTFRAAIGLMTSAFSAEMNANRLCASERAAEEKREFKKAEEEMCVASFQAISDLTPDKPYGTGLDALI